MAFATAEDVEVRLGRPLTEAEKAQAEATIESVTGLIWLAVDRDQAWAEALDPVPATLKSLCVEKALGVIVNPTNIASGSEKLGQYEVSQTFPRAADIGVFLSDTEERRARLAVYGQNAASSTPQSAADRLVEMRESTDPDLDIE